MTVHPFATRRVCESDCRRWLPAESNAIATSTGGASRGGQKPVGLPATVIVDDGSRSVGHTCGSQQLGVRRTRPYRVLRSRNVHVRVVPTPLLLTQQGPRLQEPAPRLHRARVLEDDPSARPGITEHVVRIGLRCCVLSRLSWRRLTGATAGVADPEDPELHALSTKAETASTPRGAQ